MTKQVQRRRGTNTQHTGFTGADGEISVNTTNKSIHVHDGATAGGFEAARADLLNVDDADVATAISGGTVSSLTITSADINGGTIDGTSIGANSAAAGTFTTLSATTLGSAVDLNSQALTNANIDSGAIDGVTLGTNSAVTEAQVDNININGNTIISTDTNGNIALTPNGTGEVDISKVDIASGEIDGTTIGASSAAAITGTTITGTSFVSSGDMTFGDNDKANFGADSDLQIYHDGANSVIDDTGGGRLYLRSDPGVIISKYTGEVCAQFNADDDVKLYYDNALKLATTSDGIDVTGTVRVVDSSADPLVVERSTAGNTAIQVTDGTDTVYFGMPTGGGFAVDNDANLAAAPWLKIDSSGNLLVGTTGVNAAGVISVDFDGQSKQGITLDDTYASTGGYYIYFRNSANAQAGAIIHNGSTTVNYSTSSDYRLKTAVNYDWDATTRLKQLKPARFEWIADGDNAVPVDGFLAHEVQEIVPEAICGTKDAMMDEEYEVTPATGDIYTPAVAATYDDDGNKLTAATDEVIHSTDVERPEELAEGQQWRETTAAVMGTRSVPDYQGIDQSKLVPLLVKTIQELEARITALENA